MLFQKLLYIHQNPVRVGICNVPEDYRFSSASLYANDTSEWDFLEKWEQQAISATSLLLAGGTTTARLDANKG